MRLDPGVIESLMHHVMEQIFPCQFVCLDKRWGEATHGLLKICQPCHHLHLDKISFISNAPHCHRHFKLLWMALWHSVAKNNWVLVLVRNAELNVKVLAQFNSVVPREPQWHHIPYQVKAWSSRSQVTFHTNQLVPQSWKSLPPE